MGTEHCVSHPRTHPFSSPSHATLRAPSFHGLRTRAIARSRREQGCKGSEASHSVERARQVPGENRSTRGMLLRCWRSECCTPPRVYRVPIYHYHTSRIKKRTPSALGRARYDSFFSCVTQTRQEYYRSSYQRFFQHGPPARHDPSRTRCSVLFVYACTVPSLISAVVFHLSFTAHPAASAFLFASLLCRRENKQKGDRQHNKLQRSGLASLSSGHELHK